MESKSYKLLIELLCSGCGRGNCYEHISCQMITDPRSGLEAEAVCVCKNHNTNN